MSTIIHAIKDVIRRNQVYINFVLNLAKFQIINHKIFSFTLQVRDQWEVVSWQWYFLQAMMRLEKHISSAFIKLTYSIINKESWVTFWEQY